MPKYDVHQATFVNDAIVGRSKVRITGENAVDAAVLWVKMHGFRKADEKEVRILGDSTKFITANYYLNSGADKLTVEMIPVEESSQCDDCGYPKEAPNPTCYGQCEENRQKNTEIVLDLDQAEEALSEAF